MRNELKVISDSMLQKYIYTEISLLQVVAYVCQFTPGS